MNATVTSVLDQGIFEPAESAQKNQDFWRLFYQFSQSRIKQLSAVQVQNTRAAVHQCIYGQYALTWEVTKLLITRLYEYMIWLTHTQTGYELIAAQYIVDLAREYKNSGGPL